MRGLRESGSSRSGEVLNGTYELRDLVRSDGPLEVYHAVERRMHRRVSVTLIRPEFALQAKVVDDFVRIPRQLLATKRVGWPEVLAVDTDDTGVPFVVFELRAGQGPTALLERLLHAREHTQPISDIEQLAAASQAAQLLAAAPQPEPAQARRPEQKAAQPKPAEATKPAVAEAGRSAPVEAAKPAGTEAAKAAAAKADAAGMAKTMLAPAPAATPAKPEASALPLTAAEPAKPAQEAKPAQVVTISSLGAAFDPLQGETKAGGSAEATATRKKKEARAKAADKDDEKRGKDASAKPKDAWVSKRKSSDKTGDGGARAADVNGSARGDKSGKAGDAAARPLEGKGSSIAATMTAGQTAGKSPVRSGEGAKAAIALTEAQLNALRTMRISNDDTRKRWTELILLLLFLVMLQFGAPLLYQPKLARAQELFGNRTKLVAAGFAISSVVALVRVWAARVSGKSPLLGAVTYVMQIVTLSVVALSVSMFMPEHSLGMLEFGLRKVLPWASSLLFLAFGVLGAVSGARHLTQHAAYALLVLMMSSGSLYGSYNVVTKSMQLAAAEKKQRHARVKHAPGAPVDPNEKDEADDLLDDAVAKPGGPKSPSGILDQLKAATQAQPAEGTVSVGERKEVGGSEQEDMKAADGLESSRKQNQAALEKLSGTMGPTPSVLK